MTDNNIYLKKTALKAGSCFVCFKLSSAVLRNQKDWFYICESHLKDLKFCKPFLNSAGTSTSTGLTTTPSNTDATTPSDATKSTKDSKSDSLKPSDESKFILHSSFVEMRQNLKKPKKVFKFPEIPNRQLN